MCTADCKIYEIPCANCECTYIGETGRKCETRMNEHKKATDKLVESKGTFTWTTRKQSGSEQSKSAVAYHAVQQNHVINWKEAQVITTGNNQGALDIKEAIHIRKTVKSRNRDEGAHQLSHVYDPILRRLPSVGQHKRGRLDQPSTSL